MKSSIRYIGRIEKNKNVRLLMVLVKAIFYGSAGAVLGYFMPELIGGSHAGRFVHVTILFSLFALNGAAEEVWNIPMYKGNMLRALIVGLSFLITEVLY